VARIGEERGVHRVLVGKPERKRPLGIPRRRWEDNINPFMPEVAIFGICARNSCMLSRKIQGTRI
jgi:hypothetical protein